MLRGLITRVSSFGIFLLHFQVVAMKFLTQCFMIFYGSIFVISVHAKIVTLQIAMGEHGCTAQNFALWEAGCGTKIESFSDSVSLQDDIHTHIRNILWELIGERNDDWVGRISTLIPCSEMGTMKAYRLAVEGDESAGKKSRATVASLEDDDSEHEGEYPIVRINTCMTTAGASGSSVTITTTSSTDGSADSQVSSTQDQYGTGYRQQGGGGGGHEYWGHNIYGFCRVCLKPRCIFAGMKEIVRTGTSLEALGNTAMEPAGGAWGDFRFAPTSFMHAAPPQAADSEYSDGSMVNNSGSDFASIPLSMLATGSAGMMTIPSPVDVVQEQSVTVLEQQLRQAQDTFTALKGQSHSGDGGGALWPHVMCSSEGGEDLTCHMLTGFADYGGMQPEDGTPYSSYNPSPESAVTDITPLPTAPSSSPALLHRSIRPNGQRSVSSNPKGRHKRTREFVDDVEDGAAESPLSKNEIHNQIERRYRARLGNRLKHLGKTLQDLAPTYPKKITKGMIIKKANTLLLKQHDELKQLRAEVLRLREGHSSAELAVKASSEPESGKLRRELEQQQILLKQQLVGLNECYSATVDKQSLLLQARQASAQPVSGLNNVSDMRRFRSASMSVPVTHSLYTGKKTKVVETDICRLE